MARTKRHYIPGYIGHITHRCHKREFLLLKRSHKGWVKEYLGDGQKIRQEEWTSSIAVGSRSFVEHVKALLGYRAKGRDIIGGNEGYQLREGSASYKALFGAEN